MEQDTFEENRTCFSAPNGDDRRKNQKNLKKKTHIIVKSIHLSLTLSAQSLK